MRRAISMAAMICALGLPKVTLAAAQVSPALVDGGAEIWTAQLRPVAFGDGPPTGQHRQRRARSGDVPKPVAPSHADMNGATRDSADKAYRKQFGF